MNIAASPLRVLVTGYGPFQGIQNNPSDRLAREVSQMPVAGANLEYRRLEVNHDSVDRFIDEVRKNPPDVIVSMGVSSKAQLEELPKNWIGGGREGETYPAGAIVPGQADTLPTELPVTQIEQSLQGVANRTVGTHLSDPHYGPDRSGYLCNYLNFKLTDAFAANPRTTAGFVHVTNATHKEEIHRIVQTVVQAHGAAHAPTTLALV